jgi:hypothetical protein
MECEWDDEKQERILPEGVTEADFDTLPHYSPEQQDNSVFCFSGTPLGVENLKSILPIIEECGCEWSWNESGNQRISISW